MLTSFYRTVLFYFLLLVVMRLLGKRQLGQMEPSEFVVTMMIANLATIPMENIDLPVQAGILPILTILVLEMLLALLSLKNTAVRKLLCGKPVILIENGHILQENLRKNRITLDELTGHLRQKDVLDLASVQYAILETNGNLSVFPFPEEAPARAKDAGITPKTQYLAITIISDGKIIPDNLKKAGKTNAWVEAELKKRKTRLEDTLLLTLDDSGAIYFCPTHKGG